MLSIPSCLFQIPCTWSQKIPCKESLVAPKNISSTYSWTIRISFPLILIKSVLEILPQWKFFSSKCEANLSYQALRAYLKPYNALFSLNTWLGKSGFSKPGGCLTYTSSSM